VSKSRTADMLRIGEQTRLRSQNGDRIGEQKRNGGLFGLG